jgi:hypothetical protein
MTLKFTKFPTPTGGGGGSVTVASTTILDSAVTIHNANIGYSIHFVLYVGMYLKLSLLIKY